MSKLLKESALLLLLWFAVILIGSTSLFFIHIGISRFHLMVFSMITLGIYFLWKKKEFSKKDFFKIFLVSVMVVFISTISMSFLYDRSSDGNTYHKDAIGVFKEGFNPVYESSKEVIEKRQDETKEKTEYSIWTDHYAKANWIIAANFYSLTGNIESGKAMNVISMYILFGFLFAALTKVVTKRHALIISLLVVVNPITAAQIFTYYNDQLVCIYLFLAILYLIQIEKDKKNKENWIIYILTFVILANMKFNGLGYLLVFSFLFVCKYLYDAFKQKNIKTELINLCKVFIPLLIGSLVIVGYPTYVKNTIDHHNPFFPLYDKNGEDIITHQQPSSFLKMNNIEKLFIATFSKANNLRESDQTKLKVPFTVSRDEITPAMSNDLRISGWGIWFSGILLGSIGILIKYYKQYKKETWILYTLMITTLLLLVMSESWWARYTPHFYLFIVLALYIVMKYSKNNLLKGICIALVAINTLLPLAGNTYYTVKNSITITKELKQLKNQEIIVNPKAMNGILYNLNDFHINYQLDHELSGKELYYHYIEYQRKENEE